MIVNREIEFELTDDLRRRILNVRSETDAVRLLRRLGVRARVTGLTSRDFKYIAGCIRHSEQRYGRAPLDFSDDPLMGMGRFIASDSTFWRRVDYERPVIGIKVVLGAFPPGWNYIHVLPLRAEPTEVIIPEDITKMEACSFMNCSRIRKVTIPSSMTEIPAGAFWGCSGLEEIVVPNGVTSLGPAAFADCKNLRRVTLPPSLEHVGCGAFRGCAHLKEVISPAGFAVPRSAHVFEGCKLRADAYCHLTDQPVDKDRALQELAALFRGFASRRLDGSNSIHSLMLDEIEAQDLDDIDERLGDADIAVYEMLQSMIDNAGPVFADDYFKATEDDLLLLSRLIVDALDAVSGNGHAIKVYDCPRDLWDECEEHCFIMTGALVIRVGDTWYVLFADWSD